MVIELITSITLLQTSFSLHRANPSEAADTSFQTSEPNRAYKHREDPMPLEDCFPNKCQAP